MRKLIAILFLVLSFGCSNNDPVNPDSDNNSIGNDLTGVLNLFPLALNPEFTAVSEVDLNDAVLVGIITFGLDVRIFPYPFIVHNEIVNDTYLGQKYAFSYCPITKSSLAFTRDEIFRASGLLYKDNLAPWDDKTETIWSQMLIRGIKGSKENIQFNTIPVLETTWRTAKQYFPNAKVVSPNIFASKDTPPDNGGNSNSENTPGSNALVYGILNDFNNIRIFKYSDFGPDRIINITIQSEKFIVYGNSSKNIMNAFKVDSFSDYTVLENDLPYILKHSNGVKFDFLGRGTNGTILKKPKFAYVAIWSAWKDFYSNFTFQE